jgi:MFS family permease
MLADRIGRKPIVLISLAGFIVTNLVLATVNTRWSSFWFALSRV